jgi:hypothetical protein
MIPDGLHGRLPRNPYRPSGGRRAKAKEWPTLQQILLEEIHKHILLNVDRAPHDLIAEGMLDEIKSWYEWRYGRTIRLSGRLNERGLDLEITWGRIECRVESWFFCTHLPDSESQYNNMQHGGTLGENDIPGSRHGHQSTTPSISNQVGSSFIPTDIAARFSQIESLKSRMSSIQTALSSLSSLFGHLTHMSDRRLHATSG